MTLDDSSGALLELLRPKSAIARMAQPCSAEPLRCAIGSGAILRVLAPAPSAYPDRATLRTATELDRDLRRWLPSSAYGPWRGHLIGVAAGASALSQDLRTALLTPVPESGGDASLAWFLGGAAVPARLYLAALIAGGTRRRRARVVFDHDVRCDLCERPQYAAGHELQALGSRALADLDVTPICMECLGTAARDPASWERRRVREAGARLRVVAGERTARIPWKDRSRLRIVRAD